MKPVPLLLPQTTWRPFRTRKLFSKSYFQLLWFEWIFGSSEDECVQCTSCEVHIRWSSKWVQWSDFTKVQAILTMYHWLSGSHLTSLLTSVLTSAPMLQFHWWAWTIRSANDCSESSYSMQVTCFGLLGIAFWVSERSLSAFITGISRKWITPNRRTMRIIMHVSNDGILSNAFWLFSGSMEPTKTRTKLIKNLFKIKL